MTERTIRADRVELATQSFGDPSRPPILLIMGGMASMLWWPEALCERLARSGRYVIRYDNRDTGLSTKYPAGEPGYTFEDMVDDVFRVLDGYAIRAAHIVGMSLGAMIGQVAAIKQPSRMSSLTAISSSPIGMDTSHLPQFSEAFLARMDVAENVDWSDRSQVIACMVEDSRVLAGTAHPFDEVQARAFIARDYDRSGGYLSAMNHGALKLGDGCRGRLSGMKVPLLVIHALRILSTRSSTAKRSPRRSPPHGSSASKAEATSCIRRIGTRSSQRSPGTRRNDADVARAEGGSRSEYAPRMAAGGGAASVRERPALA